MLGIIMTDYLDALFAILRLMLPIAPILLAMALCYWLEDQ